MLTHTILKELISFSNYVVEKAKKKKKKFEYIDIFDALADAADRHKKCNIIYKKPGGGGGEYHVAPYSLRWNGDNEMLYAYDFADGHIKSFFMNGIRGVEVTQLRFVPKFEIEIG